MHSQRSIFDELPAESQEYQPAATGATTGVAGEAGEAHRPVGTVPALVAVPPPPRPPFELELRRLLRRRLNGELDYETFCRLNLELHFRYGRSGYDLEQYERDLREYRERHQRGERRRRLEHALRAKLELCNTEEEPRHALGA